MDICKRLLAGLAVLALGVAPVVAERRFEKKADATNVVTGQVVKVYSKDSKLGIDGVFTSYLIEIKVEAIEKGQGIKADEPLYVRCSRPTKHSSTPVVGPSGHKYIPREGEKVRAFLNRQGDGGYEVSYPDGLEALDKQARRLNFEKTLANRETSI